MPLFFSIKRKSDDSQHIMPRHIPQRSSLHESSSPRHGDDSIGKLQPQSEKEHRHSLPSMSPSKGGSSSNGSSLKVVNCVSGKDVSTSLLANDVEVAAHTPRRSIAASGTTQRPSSSKVELPRLASAQSLHSGKGTPDASLTPVVGSAPSISVKLSFDGADRAAADTNEFSPMKRHPATGPALASRQPLRRTPAHRRCSPTRAAATGRAPPSASAAHLGLVPPIRIATEVTTPDANKTKSTAGVASVAASPTTPSPKAPTPVFSAMESVPRRPGASFRLQKRRKSLLDGAGGLPGNVTKNSNSSMSLNNSSDSMTAMTATSAAAGPPSSSSTTAAVFDATRKDRQSNGGGSNHDRRHEPAAGFTNMSDKPSQRSSASAPSGSFKVPQPPPVSADDIAPRLSQSPPARHHHHRHGSAQSASGAADDREFLDRTPSLRRSRRSSMRVQTLHSAGSLRSTSLSNSDDTPRPLTRHASTLSNDQREALRKTPSFLSRVHTPPPSDLREAVQLRRVRRPSFSDTPPLSSSHTKPDTSFTSDSSLPLSGDLNGGCEESRIAPTLKNNGATTTTTAATAAAASPSPPQPNRDAAAALTSLSTSLSSAQVRPASRTSRSLSMHMPDLKTAAPSPSAAAGENSGSAVVPSSAAGPVARPSSVRSSHRHRQDLLSKSNPPLSVSPERTTTTTPGAKMVSAAPPVVPGAVSDQPNHTSSNASVFSSDAELFDYYGSFMLTAPQFDRGSGGRLALLSPPPGDAARPAEAVAARSTPTPSNDSKKNGMVSGSVASEPASVGDILPLSPATPEPTDGAVVKPKAAVRPTGRQRQVNIFIDDDADIYETAKDVVVSEGDASEKTKSKTDSTSSRYDYLLESESLRKDVVRVGAGAGQSPSFTPTPSSAPVPAKRLVLQPLPASVTVAASATAISKLSSSDDEDDENDDTDEEEDAETLLEGFRPALFDVVHERRRGSSILFYLNKEDSLSSLDVVVKPSSDGRSTAKVILSPLTGAKQQTSLSSSQQQQRQSDYSMLKVSSSSPLYVVSANDTTGSGSSAADQPGASVARPRVTMEAYVPLGSGASSAPLAPPTTTNNANSRVDAGISKSFSLLPDPYGLQLDNSSPSLPASASRLGNKAPASRAVSERSVTTVPASIFLGTTPRFAPDPQKMHRPLANTFGYTNAQRKARAAAMAAGVSLEAWERAAGMDDLDNAGDDEGDMYREVYTDENGDEWYWEEVEEDEEEDYAEEEEGEEEVEEDEGNGGNQ